jgi:NMD protein affecting ribosome stability and mRNA decay
MILDPYYRPGARYYEAVLQLRNPSEDVFRYLANQLKKRKNVYISNVEEVTNGVDIYLSDQRWTRAFGNRLNKSFKGDLTTSRKLYGQSRETSKVLYRVVVCFRLS